MKTISKLLLIVSIIYISLFFETNVKSLESGNFEIYPIIEDNNDSEKIFNKNKETLLKIVINQNKLTKNIIETNNNIVEIKKEQERIEQERIERERKKQEQLEIINNYNQDGSLYDSKYTDLATYALQFVGNPYVAGGTSLTEGADCSGFVMKLYEHYGVTLPRTAPAQATVGYGVSLENAQPGDIVSYGYNGVVSHSAIYIGNNMIVHAATPRDGITTANVNMMPIITIRRIN